MKKNNHENWFIEKDNKLYMCLPESEKKKAHEYFKDLKGLIKTKMSAVELVKQLRKEIQLNTGQVQQGKIKQRI